MIARRRCFAGYPSPEPGLHRLIEEHLTMETLQVLSSPVSQTVRVLSIDAWREGNGWSWNSWTDIGRIDVAVCDLPARALLKVMRDEGYLSAYSAGRVAVEDDGYNVVIVQRADNMPLFAIAYGEAA